MDSSTTVSRYCITLLTKVNLDIFVLGYRKICFSALPFIVSFFVVRVCSNFGLEQFQDRYEILPAAAAV